MSDDRQRGRRMAVGTGYCSSGKRVYPDRATAKTVAARAERGGRGRMRPYRCGECRGIHLGHLPGAVVRGEVTADEWYASKNEASR